MVSFNMAVFDLVLKYVGVDRAARPVIFAFGAAIPAKNVVDPDRMLLYVIKTLDSLVSNDYTLVYVHSPNNRYKNSFSLYSSDRHLHGSGKYIVYCHESKELTTTHPIGTRKISNLCLFYTPLFG